MAQMYFFPLGTYYPAKEQLTCPGVCVGSDQGDPVRDLVAKYQVILYYVGLVRGGGDIGIKITLVSKVYKQEILLYNCI